MIQWVRHRWALEGPRGEAMGEAWAYTACCSPGDAQLEQHFDSTRELEADDPRTCRVSPLMKGWIRFG